MRRFAWVVTIPVTLFAVVFAVVNRDPITVNLWPLPWVATPTLSWFVGGCILFGFLLGAIAAWASGGKSRRKVKEFRRRLDQKQSEIDQLKRDAQARASAPQPGKQTLLPPAA